MIPVVRPSRWSRSFRWSSSLASMAVAVVLGGLGLGASVSFGGLSLVGCDEIEKKPSVDRQRVLADTAEKVIVPTYAELSTAAAKLSVDANALRDAPSEATLAAAQASWKAARLPWTESRAFLFGPAKDAGYADELDFTTDETEVETEAAGTAEPTDAYLQSLGARKRGLQALEILLFEPAGNAAVLAKLTTGDSAAHRRAYLAALAARVAVKAAELHAAWDPAKGNFVAQLRDAGAGSTTYPEQKQAVDALLNAIVFGAEDISDNRFGKPLGIRDGGIIQPGSIVSGRSGNDLAEIEAYWRGVGSAYECTRGGVTGVSLSDAVKRESDRADGEARIAIEQATSAVGTVQAPFATALTSDATDVTAAREAARKVKNILASEVASILGLTIKFNTNDGDLPMSSGLVGRWRLSLAEPVDNVSVSLYRVVFGLLMLVAVGRFFASGWIAEYYVDARFFFPFFGLTWLRPLPGVGMYLVFAAMGLAALGIALGLFFRASAAVFAVLFTYAHLVDKTHYLNHYHLISLLAALCVVMPLHQRFSLDARRDPSLAATTAPRWVLALLRFQIGCVYFFGGVAKINPDWLLRAQPLRIWLAASGDVPFVGRLLVRPETAFFMSWAGLFFDLSVPFLLLFRRTRLPAYLALVGFHVVTGKLFQLGMFPWIMSLSALLFFPPETFARVVERLGFGRTASPAHPAEAPASVSSRAMAALAIYVAVQLALPLRQFLYPGNACWTEQGYFFAWKVMLMEKNGDTEHWIVDQVTGRRTLAEPREVLTPYQKKVMSTQPTMILAYARYLGPLWEQKLGHPVEVHVDSFVSLNGARRQRLIDPSIDLSRERDGLAPRPWILPFSPVDR